MENIKISKLDLPYYEEDLIFSSEEGNIFFKNHYNEGKQEKIKYIEVKINTKINIKFNTYDHQIKDIHNQSNEIAYFKIEFESHNFKIEIDKFYITDSTHKNVIYGKTNEIKILKGMINQNDDVNIWIPIENYNFFQKYPKKFLKSDLKDFYLKDCSIESEEFLETYASYFTTDEEKKDIYDEIKLIELNKILEYNFKNITGYFFKKGKYNEIDFINSTLMGNLSIALNFYNCRVSTLRILFIEKDEENLELIFKSFVPYKNRKGIFLNIESNLFNFIESSYDKISDNTNEINSMIHYFIALENETYYEIQLVLASILLDKISRYTLSLEEIENINDLAERLIINSQRLNLNIESISRYILNSFYNELFEKILEDETNPMNFEDLEEFLLNYMSKYFLNIIKEYRNEIIHNGKINFKDYSYLHKELIEKCEKRINNNTPKDLRENYNFINKKVKNEEIYNIYNHIIILKNIKEFCILNLITILGVDCKLSEKRFIPYPENKTKKIINKFQLKT